VITVISAPRNASNDSMVHMKANCLSLGFSVDINNTPIDNINGIIIIASNII
jgi:hypothetical protein